MLCWNHIIVRRRESQLRSASLPCVLRRKTLARLLTRPLPRYLPLHTELSDTDIIRQAPIRFRTLDFVDEDVPPPPAAKPHATKRPRAGGRGGGRAGGRADKESRTSRSSSQPTPAAKTMVEEDEDDFIEDRPHRACASQVWRIWPLFELFLDNLGLVWLFCRDFLSSLEIFCCFLEIFSSSCGDFRFGYFQ